jgi:PAT family beta-lactamase induction signal transducer AmpG
LNAVASGPEEDKALPQKQARRAPWWVLSSYFAEGFPFYMLRVVTPYFLKQAGHSNTLTGMVSVLFIPWTLKFLWAPLVDLYSTKRRWIVGCEILISLFLFALAGWMALNPEVIFTGWQKWSFVVLVFLGSAVSATHDIAIDAAYIENLSPKSQEAWAGTRVAAYRVAMILGKSVILVLAGLWSWPLAMALAGVLFLGIAALHWRTLPRGEPRPIEGRPSPVAEFKEAFRTFLMRDRAVQILLFAFFFKIGDGLLFSMSNNFLDDLGVETMYIGIFGSTDVLASISGALLGGWLICRYSLVKMLIPLALLMNVADLAYAYYATLGLAPEVVQRTAFFVTGFEQFVGGLGTAAYSVAFMFFARGRHTASHFALLTAVMGVEVLVAGPLGGFMADTLGWSHYFVFCFAMGMPGVVIAGWVLPVIDAAERVEVLTDEA